LKIAVCVKHAIDETELRIDPSGRPQLEGAVSRISTFDKNAVEEAVRLRAAHSGEVVAFTIGTSDAKRTLKEALAMGADRGVIILPEPPTLDALRTAELLSAAIKKGGPFEVVLCSEGSSDTYTGAVPPMLGELLAIPYIGYAKRVEVVGQTARLERSLEDSVEVVEAPIPFVASVVSEINEPRYPTLIQIMQASKKPVEELREEELAGPRPRTSLSVISMSAQASNRKRVMIEGSPEEAAVQLVEALEKEGVLAR